MLVVNRRFTACIVLAYSTWPLAYTGACCEDLLLVAAAQAAAQAVATVGSLENTILRLDDSMQSQCFKGHMLGTHRDSL